MTETVVDYLAKRDAQIEEKVTSPMYEAYCLQESIKERKKQLKEDEAKLAEMYAALSCKEDAAFSFTNLKAVWEFDNSWIQENMSGVYDSICKMTPTDTQKLFASCFTDAEITAFLLERVPDKVAELRHITKTDFVKAVGRKTADSLCGKAYHETWVLTGKSEIVLKQKPVMFDYPRMELKEGRDAE